MSDDREFVVGSPEEESPGSVEHVCNDCGSSVFVSAPSSIEAISNGGVPICVHCAFRRRRDDPEVEDVINDDVVAEVAAFLGRPVTREELLETLQEIGELEGRRYGR